MSRETPGICIRCRLRETSSRNEREGVRPCERAARSAGVSSVARTNAKAVETLGDANVGRLTRPGSWAGVDGRGDLAASCAVDDGGSVGCAAPGTRKGVFVILARVTGLAGRLGRSASARDLLIAFSRSLSRSDKADLKSHDGLTFSQKDGTRLR